MMTLWLRAMPLGGNYPDDPSLRAIGNDTKRLAVHCETPGAL